MTKAKITHSDDDKKAGTSITTDEVDNSTEGKLAVDVYETTTKVIVIAPIAGVEIKDLEVVVEDDVLTIRGNRHHVTKKIPTADFLIQECFWGHFSRSIILPPNLDGDKIAASFKRGILQIEIPKKADHKSKSIHINN